MKAKVSLATMWTLALALVIAVASVQGLNAQEEKDRDVMQIARGAKAWVANCGRCHLIRSPRELNDEEWDVSVTHMRVRANLPGNVAVDIIEFLKANN